MKTITVKVRPRPEDRTNVCTLDPVAQALREAVGLTRATPATATRTEAMAQPSRLFACGPRGAIKCDTPPAVAAKIKEWDATGDVDAFDFDVELLPAVSFDVRLANWLYPGYQLPGLNR